MNLARIIRHWWWAQQRAIDLRVLWPQCCELALNLHAARAAFALHAFKDAAWIEFYGHDRLVRYIDAMTEHGPTPAIDGLVSTRSEP